MADDIHKIWKLWGPGGLIERIGPHRTIRELKKRGEAGAVIGWTLYKLLIEKWMDTAMNMVDPGARGPSYDFIEAAGEGELIPKIEALHEKYPPKLTLIKEKEELVSGIPVNIRFDLKDEWNAQLEKKVGRRIPLDPRDASKKDIEESKKVVELLAAGEGLPRPLKPKLEREELPPPVKPAERVPGAAPPEVVPMPITVKAVPELELMKKEIEERIEEEKRRRLKRGPIAGESSEEYLMKDAKKKTSDLPLEERLKTARAIAAAAAGPVKPAAVGVCPEIPGFAYCPTCKFKYSVSLVLLCPYRPEPTRLFREGGGVSKSFTEFIKWVEIVKDMGDLDQLKKLYNEVDTIPVLSSYDKLQLQKFIMTRMQDILELQEKGKPPFPEQFRENNKDKNEDVMQEPRDYTQWQFADFEVLIPGLEDPEDLEELLEYTDATDRLTEDEAKTLRDMILARLKEVQAGG